MVPEAFVPDDLEVGDVLATPVTGAYGYAMASNYNKVPRPPVVFVADGTARVVVRRETFDDLTRPRRLTAPGGESAGHRARTLYRLTVTAERPAPCPTPTRRRRCASACSAAAMSGRALAEILLTRSEDVAARTGIRLELVGIAVADPERARPLPSRPIS